jgi:hypothetical protein
VIISVGYRVKSKPEGTRFRIWANRILKDFLVKGYALNQQRLTQQQENIRQLERTLTLFQQNLIEQASLPEARGLVSVIAGYARTFVLLNQFDSERLPLGDFATTVHYEIREDEALGGIAALKADMLARGEASALFGNQKDDSFAGILGNILQSFGGEFLYPSIEEQAAHLLYFVIKNHPFSDGNKRIGAFLFIWFLMNATASIVSRVWSFCTTLRDDGVGYGDYLEQLTYLIFLKMADEYGRPPYNRKIGIPTDYAWPSLKAKRGAELEVHYVSTLRELGVKPGLLGQIFTKAQNKIQDPAKLSRLIDMVDETSG